MQQHLIKAFLNGLFALLSPLLTDLEKEPASGGRQMTSHFGTRSLNEDGSWKKLTEQKNSSADISPTAGQMPRLLGLAQASKYYRNVPQADTENQFSISGNEIAFGTIGDASTSEGHFWETINAGGVLQVPMIVSIWDDGYGISVPAKFQRTKSNLSELLSGFGRTEEERGYEIISVKAWDYPALIEAYTRAEKFAREHHIPCIVHVQECTQPQGHSTSGSHERYKNEERLAFETEFDCLNKFREWIETYSFQFEEGGDVQIIATKEELYQIESEAKKIVKDGQKQAWENYQTTITELKNKVLPLVEAMTSQNAEIADFVSKFKGLISVGKKDIFHLIRQTLLATRGTNSAERQALKQAYESLFAVEKDNYSSHLYSQS